MTTHLSRELQIAIIGCGRAAQQHVEAIGMIADKQANIARLAAIADHDPIKGAAMAAATGAELRRLEEILADPQIDIISICTPPSSHAAIAIAAIQAGKSIVIEKPVAGSVAELDAIVSAVEAATSGVFAVAMLQHRGRLPAAALDNSWGGDASGSVEVLRPRDTSHYLADAWRSDPDQSAGGHVAHLGVHHLDMACQVLGEPVSIEGLVECRDAPGIDTRAALAVRFESGAMLSVLASAHPAPRGERLHVFAGERELIVSDSGTDYRPGHEEHKKSIPTSRLRAMVYDALFDALNGGPAPDLYAVARARGVTAILEAVKRLAMKEVFA